MDSATEKAIADAIKKAQQKAIYVGAGLLTHRPLPEKPMSVYVEQVYSNERIIGYRTWQVQAGVWVLIASTIGSDITGITTGTTGGAEIDLGFRMTGSTTIDLGTRI